MNLYFSFLFFSFFLALKDNRRMHHIDHIEAVYEQGFDQPPNIPKKKVRVSAALESSDSVTFIKWICFQFNPLKPHVVLQIAVV